MKRERKKSPLKSVRGKEKNLVTFVKIERKTNFDDQHHHQQQQQKRCQFKSGFFSDEVNVF
jgi:hypothetical protein